MTSDRFKKGLEILEKTTGASAKAIIGKLNEIHPGLGDCVVEFAYADVMSRPGLDLKTRQLANVVGLATLGNATLQLKVHVQGALDVGWTKTEIKEAIMQVAGYAGFPAMINAMFAAHEVFTENN